MPATANGAFDLPLGASVTIKFQAKLADSVTPGQVINNTGDVIWTSTDGANPDERGSGNGLLNGGGLNDYKLQASADLTTSNVYSIAKALESTSVGSTAGNDVTIGEEIVYALTVTLPEGAVPTLQVIDNLPPGLGCVANSAVVDTTGFAGTVPTPSMSCTGGSGDDVTFSFGAITVTGDNDTNNNSFTIRFRARVLNVLGNVGVTPQTTLPNSATAQVASGPVVSSNTVTATVVEPRIATTKAVTPATAVQAGTGLNYTVTFANTGTSPAYDVTAQDTLAQGVTFTAGSLDCKLQPGDTAVDSTATASSDGSKVTFDGNPAGSWDIPVGKSIVCQYTATAQDSLYVNGGHTNTVDADWSSLDGASTGERIYDDSTNYTVDGTQDTATATFTVAAPTFTKSDGGTTQVVIGNVIHYVLTITSPLGTIQG